MKRTASAVSLSSGVAAAAAPAVLGVFMVLLAGEAAGKPRSPVPPYPETGISFSEHWDQPYGFAADQVVAPNVWGESWSGYCLDRTAPAVAPCAIPAAVTNGALVDPVSGAVRFWYQPAFGGGAGPGHVARLLTLVSAGGGTSAAWWSLVVSPDGGTLSLICGEEPLPCLSAPLAIQGWNLITLCYSSTNSAIFINDTLAAAGGGLPSLPAQLVPYTSLVIGSGLDGMETAAGQIDELTVFSGRSRFRRQAANPFGVTPLDIAAYWQCYASTAALGPISPEEEAEQAAAREARRAARSLLSAAGMNSPMDGPQPDGPTPDGPQPPCGTNDIHHVWMTNATAGYFTNQGWTVSLTIAGGTNGVLYDVFGTGALSNVVSDSYWVWLTNGYACDRITLTNQWPGARFYLLGLPTDTDSGGLSDAYENLITHGNIQDPNDDLVVPMVGIYAVDSVASEQAPTNTATFLVTRRGGRLNLPLTIGCLVSGTATLGTDYTLAPATSTPTNVLVTIPAGLTNVSVALTAITDTNIEGSEMVTLTLTTNVAPCDVNPAHASATAWILEEYSYTYTTVADFKQGVLDGLEPVDALPTDNGHLQFKTNLPPQFPFINVACSDRGTVARINVTNGAVIGEYRTAPLGLVFIDDNGNPAAGASPSRTTVDQYGNVWVANRFDRRAINGTNCGSIVRIGLIVGGTRYQKNANGSYTTNAHGHYVSLADAAYNTCADRDGDGYICTSAGLADILPWNNGAGADSDGGVSTAEDEAITEYTRVLSVGTRTIAVDRFNDIWVGGHVANKTHLKVNGLLGLPVPNSAFDPFNPGSGLRVGGYGGVIDGLGNLWSSEDNGENVLWLVPSTNYPPQQNTDWQHLTAPGASSMYGIAVDPLHPYVWQTTGGAQVFRWHTNGTPELDGTGHVILYPHSDNPNAGSQGLAVDARGQVWVSHKKEVGSHTVGHLYTNGLWLGNVELQVSGLWAEYFGNTNLGGLPVLTNTESLVDFSSTTNWPACEEPTNTVPTNAFSVRWAGVVQPLVQGEHVFYVRAEDGAAYRLMVNGAVVIDNWTHPATNTVELSGTNWLATNVIYGIRLEYAHLTTNGAGVSLSWTEPENAKEVVPAERFGPLSVTGRSTSTLSGGATGISVDAAGRIWAGCFDSDTAVRIDPNAGRMVVTADGVTNHVGLVDMMVDLGDGTWHTPPYNVQAHPYNYSDMTGFNVRVVNPGLKPLKGYWVAVNDSGNHGQLWNKVSWSADGLTNGCSVEVYVRASDERNGLGSEAFVPATNNVFFPSIRGRFIEVRLAMTRDDASKEPVVYDLTLYGVSSGFIGDYFLDDARADERQDATFVANIVGPEPMGYEWFRMYPWETNWVQVPGATGSSFVITNVDSWVDWTMVSVLVTNGNGESLWLGPAYLEVWPLANALPASSSSGPARHYPATINVFDQPTNLNSVIVTLWGLTHTRSADLNLLVLSPSGKRIILMSNVGGTNGVSDANLEFRQDAALPAQAAPILPQNAQSHDVQYQPSNYGQKTPQTPFGLPSGPYSSNLQDLQGDDPNGVWELYIYDDVHPGGTGQLLGSWSLDLTFQ